jgi:hypothetical protein
MQRTLAFATGTNCANWTATSIGLQLHLCDRIAQQCASPNTNKYVLTLIWQQFYNTYRIWPTKATYNPNPCKIYTLINNTALTLHLVLTAPSQHPVGVSPLELPARTHLESGLSQRHRPQAACHARYRACEHGMGSGEAAHASRACVDRTASAGECRGFEPMQARGGGGSKAAMLPIKTGMLPGPAWII